MMIRFKAIAIFALIILSIVGASLYLISILNNTQLESQKLQYISFITVVTDELDTKLHERINILEYTTKRAFVQDEINKSNSEFEMLDDINAYINEKDNDWINTGKEITPFVKTILDNDLSKELRDMSAFFKKKSRNQIYSEIFVTNKYGAVVATTGKTTDYRQDDEQWWQVAKEKGIYIGDVEYDESADVYGLVVSIRINDKNGNFAGAMKAIIDLIEIRHMILGITLGADTNLKLLNKEGKLFYSTQLPGFNLLGDFSNTEAFKKMTGESGFFAAKDEDGGEEIEYFAYKRTPTHENVVSFDWILYLEMKENAINPINILDKSILPFFAIVILISGAISFFVYRFIRES